MKLEDLQPNASVRGILPDSLVTVITVQWFGSEALELTYKDPGGRVANQLLYRHDESRLRPKEVAGFIASWTEAISTPAQSLGARKENPNMSAEDEGPNTLAVLTRSKAFVRARTINGQS